MTQNSVSTNLELLKLEYVYIINNFIIPKSLKISYLILL